MLNRTYTRRQNMLAWIRNRNLKKAGVCSVLIGGINIILHILVITNILPFQWVNGGRTQSFVEAQQISVSSIMLTMINMLLALIASEIVDVRMNRYLGVLLALFLLITLPLSLVGVVQQFLGTTFEKCVTSVLTIIGFVCDIRIAIGAADHYLPRCKKL